MKPSSGVFRLQANSKSLSRIISELHFQVKFRLRENYHRCIECMYLKKGSWQLGKHKVVHVCFDRGSTVILARYDAVYCTADFFQTLGNNCSFCIWSYSQSNSYNTKQQNENINSFSVQEVNKRMIGFHDLNDRNFHLMNQIFLSLVHATSAPKSIQQP